MAEGDIPLHDAGAPVASREPLAGPSRRLDASGGGRIERRQRRPSARGGFPGGGPRRRPASARVRGARATGAMGQAFARVAREGA